MEHKVSLKDYNHLVIVSSDPQKAVKVWGDVFDFNAPNVRYTGEEKEQVVPNELKDKIWCKYHGKDWKCQFYQAVFPQKSAFFEINGAGKDDYFDNYLKSHRNGVCFLGTLNTNYRDMFVSECIKDGYEEIIEHFFCFGDWSVIGLEKELSLDICVKKTPCNHADLNSKIPDFSEILILVPDINKSAKTWNSIMNANIEKIYEEKQSFVYKGKKMEFISKYAKIDTGLFPIHIMEAGDKGPFADYVKEHGYGVYQIGVKLSEDKIKQVISKLEDSYKFRKSTELVLNSIRYISYNSVDVMGINISLTY
jgi:hypothetical protein